MNILDFEYKRDSVTYAWDPELSRRVAILMCDCGGENCLGGLAVVWPQNRPDINGKTMNEGMSTVAQYTNQRLNGQIGISFNVRSMFPEGKAPIYYGDNIAHRFYSQTGITLSGLFAVVQANVVDNRKKANPFEPEYDFSAN